MVIFSTMPMKANYGGNSYTAKNMLDAQPLEFRIEEKDWFCKLAYEREKDKYLLWINDTIVSQLPIAPLIEKENIPVVCQSDNLVFLGEVTKRVTFQLFINGLIHQFVADHNARSLCTFLEVDGKIEKQWDGLSLE